MQWMMLGDRNTRYFHSKALDRKRKNAISRIMDENGIWHETKEGIANVVVSYFEKLYTTSYPSHILEITDTIPTKVSSEMNQSLIKDFTKEEVLAALKQMHPTKAPSPDDMSAIFFQKYWDVVGNDVTSMVLNVLNCNKSIVEINKTYITLVPKT